MADRLSHNYRVSWEIDVVAASPLEAARLARAYQSPDTTAVVFVCADESGARTQVDLQDASCVTL